MVELLVVVFKAFVSSQCVFRVFLSKNHDHISPSRDGDVAHKVTSLCF